MCLVPSFQEKHRILISPLCLGVAHGWGRRGEGIEGAGKPRPNRHRRGLDRRLKGVVVPEVQRGIQCVGHSFAKVVHLGDFFFINGKRHKIFEWEETYLRRGRRGILAGRQMEAEA